MCGIAGVASVNGLVDASAAITALRHRGPDAEGTVTVDGDGWRCGLAHTRLAIVDLSSNGEQPMVSADGNLVMVFNGEIYNSPELRAECQSRGHVFQSTMDGEVILHLWETEKEQAFARLNGIFAVAIIDIAAGTVALARDPLGVKPLFYSSDHESIWWASELRGLLAIGAPIGNQDVVALAQFLTFLWVPDPRTPFTGVQCLRPGHWLEWTAEGMRSARFCPPLIPTGAPLSLTPEEAVDECRQKFSAAVRRQMLSDVEIGLMASGGVDSGLIWWAAQDQLAAAYTIEWGNTESGEGIMDDSRAVATLERRFGTPVVRIVGEADDPDAAVFSGDLFADPSFHLSRQIARTASERGVKVLLSGQGGDELFAGYRRHAVAPWMFAVGTGPFGGWVGDRISRRRAGDMRGEYIARMLRASSERDPFARYMQLCTYSTPAERAQALGTTTSEVSNEAVWQEHRAHYDSLPKSMSPLRVAMSLDLNVYMPGIGLAQMDRAGMEFGVEIRVPFLDLEFVRWTLQLPDAVLRRRGRGKWLTRELASRELSAAIAQRPKRAFATPVELLPGSAGGQGSLGFRQGTYFARARTVLEGFQAVSLSSSGDR